MTEPNPMLRQWKLKNKLTRKLHGATQGRANHPSPPEGLSASDVREIELSAGVLRHALCRSGVRDFVASAEDPVAAQNEVLVWMMWLVTLDRP